MAVVALVSALSEDINLHNSLLHKMSDILFNYQPAIVGHCFIWVHLHVKFMPSLLGIYTEKS